MNQPKILAAVGLIATAGALLLSGAREPAPTLLWAGWVVLPPVWFIFEWSRFEGGSASPDFADFKYSQELAARVWLAVASVLTILKVTP